MKWLVAALAAVCVLAPSAHCADDTIGGYLNLFFLILDFFFSFLLWINTAHRLSKWVNTFSFSPPAWCYHDPTCSECSPLCYLNDILNLCPSSASKQFCCSLQMTPHGPPLLPHFAMAPDSRPLTLTHQLPPATLPWGPSPFTTSTAPPQWQRLKTLERLVSDGWRGPWGHIFFVSALIILHKWSNFIVIIFLSKENSLVTSSQCIHFHLSLFIWILLPVCFFPSPPVKVALSNVNVSGGDLSETYQSLQFHLHWGNGSSVPGSEHTVDGKRYPMEVLHSRLSRWAPTSSIDSH